RAFDRVQRKQMFLLVDEKRDQLKLMRIVERRDSLKLVSSSGCVDQVEVSLDPVGLTGYKIAARRGVRPAKRFELVLSVARKPVFVRDLCVVVEAVLVRIALLFSDEHFRGASEPRVPLVELQKRAQLVVVLVVLLSYRRRVLWTRVKGLILEP